MREALKSIRILGFWRWAYARFLYRRVSRLLHRVNLHYAPPVGPPHGDNGCLQQHWCQWCGLRGDLVDINRVRMPIRPFPTSSEPQTPHEDLTP